MKNLYLHIPEAKFPVDAFVPELGSSTSSDHPADGLHLPDRLGEAKGKTNNERLSFIIALVYIMFIACRVQKESHLIFLLLCPEW